MIILAIVIRLWTPESKLKAEVVLNYDIEDFKDFNNNVRAMAEEVGAILCDANDEAAFKDPRFLAFDRLHLNPMGHDRVAQAVLETIELSFDPSWRRPLAPA